MSQPSEAVSGNIYDLGYRRYEGPRLGRRAAVIGLYLQSLRSAFGLGRRATSKIIPVALVVLASLPAAIQLGVAAISTGRVDFISAPEYYTYVQVILALFVAAVGPELVGRDQRSRTLPLYFSRPLTRDDYVIAKLAALTTAMLALTLLPQSILFIGNMFAGSDSIGFLQDNWKDIPRILVSALGLSFFVTAIALAVAAQTPRRSFATGGVIALFLVTGTVSGILVNTATGDGGRWAILVSLYDVMRGATYWVFSHDASSDDILTTAHLNGLVYVAAMATITAVATWLVFRRYRGMSL